MTSETVEKNDASAVLFLVLGCYRVFDFKGGRFGSFSLRNIGIAFAFLLFRKIGVYERKHSVKIDQSVKENYGV